MDGNGGKLHVHLLINAIKPNHKTISTNRFSVYRLRRDINKYMNDNFEQVTGRKWYDPFEQPHSDKELPSKSMWQEQLKEIINSVKKEVTNINDFFQQLKAKNINVVERGQHHNWTYHMNVNGKDKRVRAFYQRKNKNGEVVSTRGLGKDFTKSSIEQYFKQRQAQQQPSPLNTRHKRKEVINNGRQQKSDEQYQKQKILTAEARQQIAERQREHQQLLTRLRIAKLKEERQQQQAKRTAGPSGRNNGKQGRFEQSGQQERLKEVARRKLEEKQRIARNNRSKDAGPEL